MSEKQKEKRGGKIYGIFGCMFAGKSTELMRRATREDLAKNSFLIVRPSCDVRAPPGKMKSHDENTMNALTPCNLFDIEKWALQVDTIFIDEGQFFPDLIKFCTAMEKHGKTIHVAMLDSTFERKPFEGTVGIHAICCDYVKLQAVCMKCHKSDAWLSKRIGEETEEKLVGGADKYIAVCGDCFH